MKQYRIGDFAEQMGVSIDFIKYDEEKGLIKSWKDPKNRYHYYPFMRMECINKKQNRRCFERKRLEGGSYYIKP